MHALETRLELLLSLLEDQTSRGVERCNLESLARKIRDTQIELLKYREEHPETVKVQTVDERDPSDFRHGKPKKWPLRRSVRKGSYQTTKKAHPIPMSWHGRLA